MAKISLKGNIATKPESKTVTIDGDKRDIVEFRMKSTEGHIGKKDQQWVDQGSWYDVTIWGEIMSKSVLALLNNGDPIFVVGDQTTNNWVEEATGDHRQSLQIRAQVVLPWLPKLQSLEFVERGRSNITSTKPEPHEEKQAQSEGA